MSNPPSIEYRPSVALGLVFASVFAVTAAILVWIGFVLGPEARAGMDGFALILFTVVSIRWFSWAFALIFVVLGFLIARRSYRAEPTLLVAESGMTLPTGTTVPWSQIRTVKSSQNLLHVELSDEWNQSTPLKQMPFWLRWIKRRNDNTKLTLSAFELGTDPQVVAEEIENRISGTSKDADAKPAAS